jgi:hypothetical protein
MASPALAQTEAAKAPSASKAYSVPKTEWGQPDLQGVWGNNAATPLERPKELEGRTTLTENEVALLKKRSAELFNGETDAAFGDSVFNAVIKDAKTFKSTDTQTGNYNHFWIVDRNFENRTSLITDPSDGRLPPVTAEGKKINDEAAEYKKVHPADGPEDLPLTHRCVTFGVPNLFAGYNSYYQIVQSKDYVAIASEMIHDVRIIPLDNRPHAGKDVRLWLGDSRGHWEGNTLVVETTNLNDKTNFLGGKTNAHLQNLKLIEKYTRVAPDVLRYEVTLNDPSIWTKPWSATLNWSRSNEHIYEYACHEGNEGLSGALSGYRAKEREETASAIKGSN